MDGCSFSYKLSRLGVLHVLELVMGLSTGTSTIATVCFFVFNSSKIFRMKLHICFNRRL